MTTPSSLGRAPCLFYDDRDVATHEARGSQIVYWLDNLGAKPLSEAGRGDEGFLFAGGHAVLRL